MYVIVVSVSFVSIMLAMYILKSIIIVQGGFKILLLLLDLTKINGWKYVYTSTIE